MAESQYVDLTGSESVAPCFFPGSQATRSPMKNSRTSEYNPKPQKTPGIHPSLLAGSAEAEIDNPILLDVAGTQWMAGDKIVLVMVGLPARGKTHVARRLARYLKFFHAVPVEVFNVGQYRRTLFGHYKPAAFFDHDDDEAMNMRKRCSEAAMEDLKKYLVERKDSRVAIYDATNTTKARRTWVVNQLADLKSKVIFVEMICEDEKLIDSSIRAVKLNLPDYLELDPEEAVADFKARIKKYESVYEPIDENDEKHYSWIKVLDSKRFTINNIRGHLPGKIVQFIMNLHVTPQVFYLSRHGQSEYNLCGRIGGDSGLTEDGEAYARRLADYVSEQVTKDENGNEIPGRLWTSSLKRTKETAQFIQHPVIEVQADVSWENDDLQGRPQHWVQMRQKEWNNLDELYAGTCDGMTYEEIEAQYPEEFARRQKNKLAYRYPRGESYLDMMHRLEPMVLEMERIREPVLIIGHQGVLRVIYAFYMGLPREEAPYVSIPLNTVVKLTPHTYGCQEERSILLKKRSATDGQNELRPGAVIVEDPPSH